MRSTHLGGLRVARIRGVDLKIHFSLIFLLIYVVMVASLQFPFVLRQSGIDPRALSIGSGAWGFIFAAALFLSVLIHEFAHVLVAQAMGIKVAGITLMMLGGVSEMERIPETPLSEFKISIIGPLTSFALGAVLLLVRANTTSADLSFFCYWLARVNFGLGIFNLLPAFPLDGGRAFRSLLAARYGMANATRISVSVARGFAWALGILGFITFNFLLMLIAIFVYSAANSELVITVSRGLLKEVTARMAGFRIEPVYESDTLRSVAGRMLETRHRIFPVQTKSGDPAIITAEHLAQLPRDQWGELSVGQAMDRVSRYLSPDTTLDDALPDLAKAGALPIQENQQIIGLVEYGDISKWLELRGLSEHQTPERRAA